jgi:hypothetical protein
MIAETVSKRLDALFDIPERQSNLSTKKYLMLCHGCGTLHVELAYFISTPLSFGWNFEDGSSLSIGCHGCPACMKDTARPIYNAYRNGMTVEALEKAMSYVPKGSIIVKMWNTETQQWETYKFFAADVDLAGAFVNSRRSEPTYSRLTYWLDRLPRLPGLHEGHGSADL